uniref:Dynein axonemal intermediate chain 3 n=1 Tax=Cynoglossus semilaevis TaxID=244447 RepID=A0A3P8WQ05_CYNSE
RPRHQLIRPKNKNASEKYSKQHYPKDISPLVLTSATQELFGCCADRDVTRESPHKLLKKEDIIQDIKRRAAVSDFSPVKQIVLEYPDEELLLVFDRDFTYGQSFYLVITPEPPQAAVSEVVELERIKTPEPKQWISLGSELEIEEETVKETRDKLRYRFSRVRRKFGAPVCFSDRNTADAKDGHLECAAYPDSRFSIKQLQRDCGIQAVPTLQSSTKNIFTQYKPRDLSDQERESIVQSENLKNFCSSVTSRLVTIHNEQITNVFFDDWKDLGTSPEADDWSGKVSEGLTLHQAFTDQVYTKDRRISCVNWHPALYGVIAVALTEKKEQPFTFDARPSLIVFFCFSDPFNPQLLLECPDDIFAFEFCPSDPNIIVGGCVNGQIVLWDISAHVTHLQWTQSGGKKDLTDIKESKTPVVRYCAVSAVESSHKTRITDVQWLPPTFEVTRMGVPVENKFNTSVQVVSCSPDGTLMFWDVRLPRLLSQHAAERKQTSDEKAHLTPYSVPDTFKHLDRTWKPLFRVLMSQCECERECLFLKSSDRLLTCPGVNLASMPAGINDVLFCFSPVSGTKPLHCFNAHHWLVNSVQRSPFFRDIILSTGGWNFAIWKEGVMDGPLIFSHSSEQVCTAGCWSLSRPAVFYIGKDDGSIDVWDLLEKTSEPSQVYAHVTNAKITCIKPWSTARESRQHLLAVTDDDGVVRVFEIPKSLYVPSRNEVRQIFFLVFFSAFNYKNLKSTFNAVHTQSNCQTQEHNIKWKLMQLFIVHDLMCCM